MLFNGRVAVVTGASRGIGRSIAESLAGDGATVAVLSRSLDAASSVARALPRICPDSHKGYECDVLNIEEARSCLKHILTDLGPPTLLVNNIGETSDGLIINQGIDEFEAAIRVNLTSAWIMSKLVIRSMIRCKTGSIVHLGSTVGCDGQAGQIAYSSAKAGLIGMTKSMAKEFGRKGIRVNMVAPGYINTDMTNDFSPALKKSIIDNTPLQRIGSSEDVASLVRFLLSDQASFITGQCIRVDGGLSMPLM